ncbi:hypothetical protein Ahu01nite_100350 [Winogradskya humida]|uniref:Uncharacterized protein n=1 Tax=Winogradskya humida TaxID=113566 RepID=A0ABQ4A8G6_9ACTN|nr:hypothetical protein Ahu01nite_100350 [Actinoplanes humidus]
MWAVVVLTVSLMAFSIVAGVLALPTVAVLAGTACVGVAQQLTRHLLRHRH